MKTFKSFIFAALLVLSIICLGLPLPVRSPISRSVRPTPVKSTIAAVKNNTVKKQLHNGPTQPEVQSFKPADASNMVDLFSGDFSYNIPLVDVGGYPVNLFYSSNISMEDEASWVGLGWNLNPGAINRHVRGLPDDFCGEQITKSYNLKPHIVFGGSTGGDVELYGIGFSASIGMKYNNYTGVGLDLGAGISASYAISNSLNAGVAANLGLSSDAGATISPSVSLSYSMMNEDEKKKTGSSFKASAGFTWNSLDGLNSVYVAPSYHRQMNGFKDIDHSTTFPLTYARQAYTPSVTMPMKNLSLSFRLKLGGEIQGVRIAGSLGAFYSEQTLAEKQKTNTAYGYMYAQEAQGDPGALHDFNREKDGAFEINHPDLPVINATYDTYSATGQGFSGTFRPFRNDIGTVSDPANETVSNSGGGGADGALGLIAKIGVDIEFSESKTYSGPWTGAANEASAFLRFKKKSEFNDTRYEPVYFKSVGEKNVQVNRPFYNFIGKREPVALKLEGDAKTKAKPVLVSMTNTSTTLSVTNTTRDRREHRNVNFQVLTVDEALTIAEERLIKVYTGNGDGDTMMLERAKRNNFIIGGKQVSQITVLTDDGTRYVYGLPAYNFRKEEVTFNVSRKIPTETADSIILVQYDPATDNSSSNNKGTNNYFSKVETPAYAYAYYLTEVLSPDYVDLSGDGSTPDDMGSYTKFSYFRDSLYRWRSPHEKNKAFLNAGNLYDQQDDMGSYQYGEKEIFYLRTIETRNYVAVFNCSDRKDAHAVLGQDGGIDLNSSLKKLNSISLYTKSAYLKNDRTPVKKVHFEYDYSLCRKNPSSEADSGKLTLKRVYYTYLKSARGRKNAYHFQYKGMNPSYSVGASDRWGTYKSLKKRVPTTGAGIMEQSRSIANNEFPYTDQEYRKIQADSFAAAWALTDIQAMTGARLKVSYEADDYAYVQDKRAMQLMQVLGFSSAQNGQPVANIYSNGMPNNFVHIQTTHPVNAATAQELVKGISEFYFNCRVNITNRIGSIGVKVFEPVDGFFQLVNNNVFIVDSTHIVLQLKPEGNYQAVSLATLKRIKTSYPGIAYQFPETGDDVTADLGNAFLGLAKSAGDLLAGGLFNRLIADGVAGEIQPGKSFVRLNVPHFIKIGGGSRVRKLEVSDEWKVMSSGRDSTKNYTIEYDYTQMGQGNQVLSSGVASYEPVMGGSENPFMLPEYYNVSKKFSFMGIELFEVENERKYAIRHYGESFFPGPTVGYSRVTVRNNPHPAIKKHSTGKMVYTFYTAQDFPVVYKKTAVSLKQFRQFLPIIVYYSNTDHVAASQGYYFEVNDMHGKPKGTYAFSARDSVNPISGKIFYYRQANNSLANIAMVVDREGNISEAEIGVETDIIAEERESSTFVKTPSLESNVDIILVGFFPIPIPVPVPKYSSEDILFRSACVTKVSQRSGLLDSVVTFDGGARFVAKTLLYDAVTGNDVLTVTNNEFNDRIYSLSIPSHWVHEGMGPACSNYGLEIPSAAMNVNGNFEVPGAGYLFFPGDEVEVVATNGTHEKGWVLQVKGNEVGVIDAAGKKLPAAFNNASLKVTRSGRRNMQGITIGHVVTRQNPVVGNRLVLDASRQIINSNAVEYADRWQTFAAFRVRPQKLVCNCTAKTDTSTQSFAGQLLSAIVTVYLQGDSIPGVTYSVSMPQALFLKHFNLNADSICYSLDKGKATISIAFSNCSNQDRICGAVLETNSFGQLQFAGGSVFIQPDIDGVPAEGCNDYGFRMAGSTGYSIKGAFECLPLRSCQLKYVPVYDVEICGITGDSIVNPYRVGLLGNYRPLKSLFYLTERTAGRVREAGVFNSYDPYWTCAAINNARPSEWTWTEQSTKIDPFGKLVESKDSLGRYRADLVGFNNSLVIASAKNARYRQIAFLSFEDVDFRNTDNTTCWLPKHFAFAGFSDSLITEEASHTGRRSLQFKRNLDYSISRLAPVAPASPSFINGNGEYQVTSHELIGTFSPDAGEYYIDAWVRIPVDTLLSLKGLVEIEVITDSRDTVFFRPYGAMVDGWQKAGGRFTLRPGYNNVQFRFINKSAVNGYIDDIRVQPFNASMETYVYDPVNLRLMSTLDDNNFAMLYEYDEEGQLTRVKKETFQGILTVSEVRAGKPRNQ